MKIVGVDVGGTFTDIIMIDTISGSQYVHKVPSTPESQDVGVIQGIRQLLEKNSLAPNSITLVTHGTTVATNAMLERKGARVVLLTTAGMEDVLEIGRQDREEIYNLVASRPEPLVNREDRIGVKERLDFEGVPLIELASSEVKTAVAKALDRSPEAIAISLLFSYKNPNHEKMLLEEVKRACDVYAVRSSDVLPEFREFERTSTTVLEAYLGPLIVKYLERLDKSLKELSPSSRFTVMQSNGGTMLASAAQGKTVGLAISGLAGGVIGGWEIAKQCKVTKAITLDMGGTSCDISAITGNIVVRPDNEVAGFPLRMPSIDVKTIGAGGGSIAWIDDASILHVGPQSAGAAPGPAAYNKGGKDATVTDANLLLGRLNPNFFLGGNMRLSSHSARDAIAKLSKNLRMSVEETALGIVRISTANMVQAIREVTVERGSDPRQFVLVPFGGAGPTQAVDIAKALDIDRILVPPYPGITSAFGLVSTDLRVDLMKTILLQADVLSAKQLMGTLAFLSQEAKGKLVEQGAQNDEIQIEWSVDMRYLGQSHELPVTLQKESENLGAESIAKFESLHEVSFGYAMKGRQIEWVTARVSAIACSKDHQLYQHTMDVEASSQETRRVVLATGKAATAEIHRRGSLSIRQKIRGPAIIEQLDTTIYMDPDWIAEKQSGGHLWIRRAKK